MGFPRHSWLRMGRGSPGRLRGLVLVEVGLLLLVIALAALLVMLALGRARHGARLGQFASELQTYATAFEDVRRERGRWPATAEEAGARVIDAGWSAGSAIGGEYGWMPPAGGRTGMITVTAYVPTYPLALTPDDLRAVDRQIDDGDLSTGRFRTGFNGWPVYLVADKP